mgnify:FL=1|tara:strand:- start:426 stop:1928 length:1503 start_codon:yes stop_codon:yes gene_type:complete
MAYTINKSDGSVLISSLTDGTVNTTYSLQLFGRSYSGFGEGLNENLVRLLENSAGTSAPTAPIKGELWYDTSANQIKVYDGSNWKVTGSAKSQSAQPSSAAAGDLWHDSDTHQLFLYTGSEWRLTGPVYTNAQTLSGWQIETLTDAGANNYVVSTIMAANVRVAIASGSAEFTPSPAVSGFTTIKPGLNLNSNISGAVFNGSTTAANFVDVSSTTNTNSTTIAGGNFLRADANDITTGSLQVQGSAGLIVGTTAGSDSLEISRSSGDVTIANTFQGKSLSITTKSSDGSTTLTPINITSTGVGTVALSGATSITGDVTITGNLNVSGEYSNTTSTVNTIDDVFIKLNTGNSEVDSGIIVETLDTNDARLFYDVSENYWTAGENNSYSQVVRVADLTDDGDANKGTKGLTTDSSTGNLKVTSATLGAVGSDITSSTSTTSADVPSIGQVAKSLQRWGGSVTSGGNADSDGSNNIAGNRYIGTAAPSNSEGNVGDIWFVREA